MLRIMKDVYTHLKNDDGTRTVDTVKFPIDPNDTRPLYTILGLADKTAFHKHVVPGPQYVTIEDSVPLIKHHVRMTSYDTATTYRYIELQFLAFSSDSSYQEITSIIARLRALFNGQIPYNSCPANARYSMPFHLYRDPGPADSGIDGICSAFISFRGATDMTLNLIGQSI